MTFNTFLMSLKLVDDRVVIREAMGNRHVISLHSVLNSEPNFLDRHSAITFFAEDLPGGILQGTEQAGPLVSEHEGRLALHADHVFPVLRTSRTDRDSVLATKVSEQQGGVRCRSRHFV